MRPRYYILDGHYPKAVDDMMEWAMWFEGFENRRVAKTEIGEVTVSTVFLGLDHSFSNGPPVLFESMVFEGPLDGETRRYSTWRDAEIGHEELVRAVVDVQPKLGVDPRSNGHLLTTGEDDD